MYFRDVLDSVSNLLELEEEFLVRALTQTNIMTEGQFYHQQVKFYPVKCHNLKFHAQKNKRCLSLDLFLVLFLSVQKTHF